MSMRGSPINWWKEKRQSSHSGIPHTNRPQTAFPWNEDRDIAKIVEQAVLAAFESNAFKVAVASQVDPAFSRHQEKLNQIKSTNLNLESTLQAHVEDLPGVLRGIEDHLTGLVIPDYGHDLEALAVGQERLEGRVNEIHIPDYTDELNEIVSGQTRFLKTFENRLTALESRIEDLDRKTGDVDEAVVNADLRSAIRFGEISNELQDRNTTLNNSIWEVQRDLGKKTDALQRRVVGACEDMGKSIRASAETIETMRAKLDEDDVLAAVNKVSSRAEFSEKALRRSITAIQDKVSGLDTSAIPVQVAKLEVIERGISDFKKEAEAARNLASVSSKFLSANTSKLDSMASAVGKMHLLVESTNEICQEVSESQEANVGSIKEDVEAVRMHVRSLDNLAVSHSRKLSDATSILTRTEGAVVAFDAAVIGRLGDLASSAENIEERLRPLSSHSTKLDGLESSLTAFVKDSKPQRAILDDLTSTLSEMRSNVDTALSSHTDTLSTINQTVSNTASKDGLSTALSKLQSNIESKISSSHETASQSTVEAIATHVGSLDGKLQNGFRSMKDDAESRAENLRTPISDILEEVRSSKALFETEKAEIREEFNTTRSVIEASRAELGVDVISIKRLIQDIQEAGRDEEILLQVESWGQNCITKQAGEVASLKDLLELARDRDEILRQSVNGLSEKSTEISTFLRSGELESSSINRELGALKSLVENDEKLISLQDIASQASQTLSNIQQDIQHLKDDQTLPAIKQLALQNASSLATSYEGILSIDTKLKTSEETIQSTVQEMQTALGRDILDATTSLTATMHNDISELKTDLSSRMSTSTNVLRDGIKSIDLTTTSTAIEALKAEVETSTKKSEECTRGAAEDVKSIISDKIEALGRDVKDFGDTHSKELQLNAAALAVLRELSTSNTAALSSGIAEIHKTVNPISELVEDVCSIAGLAKDIDATTKANATGLSTTQESLNATAAQTESRLTELKTSVEAAGEKTLQAVQNTQNLLTDLEKSSAEGFAKTSAGIEGVDAALSKASIEIAAAGASLSSLSTTCEDIPRIRDDIKAIDGTLSNISSASGKTEAAILASAVGISAEIMGVKSDISGVAASLASVKEHATKAEDVREKILSTIEGTSAELERVQETLRRVEDSSTSSYDSVKLEIASLGSAIDKENAELKGEMQSVKEGITSSLIDLNTTLSQATTSNAAAHESTLAALQAESKVIRDAVVLEAEKGNSSVLEALEGVKMGIVEGVDASQKVMSGRVDDVAASIGEISTTLAQASSDSNNAHAATLAAVQSEAHGIRDTVTAESEKKNESMASKLDLVQGSIIADATSMRENLLPEISAVESSIRGLKEELVGLSMQNARKLDTAATEAGRKHEDILAALQTESKTLRDVVLAEGDKMNATISTNLETAQNSIMAEITNTSNALSSTKEAVTSSIQEVNHALVKTTAETTTAQSKALETLQADIKTLQEVLVSATESSKTAVLEDLAVVKISAQESRDVISGLVMEGHLKFEDTAADAKNMCQQVIASVEAQSRVLFEALTREVKDVHAAIESAKDLTVTEVQSVKVELDEGMKAVEKILSDKLGEANGKVMKEFENVSSKAEERHEVSLAAIGDAGKAISCNLDGVKRDLSEEFNKTGKEIGDGVETLSKGIDAGFLKVDVTQEATLNTIKEESKSLTDFILGESKNTSTAITEAKDLTMSELLQSKTLVEEKLGSVEKTLSAKFSETNGIITQELDNIVSKADKQHDTALEAIKLTSETCLTGVDSAELHLKDAIRELSNDIGAASHKAVADHTTTLDALTLSRTTLSDLIIREISNSTAASTTATQSLISSLSATQQSLDTLHSTTTTFSAETAANFTHAATARKKAAKSFEANVDTILEAIRQQGKTTSSSVDAMQKVVLTGVQNLNSSLEGFIERAVERGSTDLLGSIKTELEALERESVEVRRVLDGKMEGLMGVVKEEGATTRKSTENIETNTANIASQLSKGFSDLSTESKATSTALDTHVSTLSAAIKDEAETTQARVETLHSRVLDEVQKTDTALRSSLTTLKSSIEKSESTTAETHSALRADVKILSGKTLTGISDLENTLKKSEGVLEKLTPSLGAIDAAVRVNSAAIARVDKAVLESSSQVKAEIHSSVQSLGAQLEDEVAEMGRRVRGIAEFEIPRLEVLMRRQRDAVEVIGGRVIGTTKRFDEMVAGVAKVNGNGGGANGGLDKSELLGMGMSGRLRGGSNASSTRSKDSGYRMGAFESGGRM